VFIFVLCALCFIVTNCFDVEATCSKEVEVQIKLKQFSNSAVLVEVVRWRCNFVNCRIKKSWFPSVQFFLTICYLVFIFALAAMLLDTAVCERGDNCRWPPYQP